MITRQVETLVDFGEFTGTSEVFSEPFDMSNCVTFSLQTFVNVSDGTGINAGVYILGTNQTQADGTPPPGVTGAWAEVDTFQGFTGTALQVYWKRKIAPEYRWLKLWVASSGTGDFTVQTRVLIREQTF